MATDTGLPNIHVAVGREPRYQTRMARSGTWSPYLPVDYQTVQFALATCSAPCSHNPPTGNFGPTDKETHTSHHALCCVHHGGCKAPTYVHILCSNGSETRTDFDDQSAHFR